MTKSKKAATTDDFVCEEAYKAEAMSDLCNILRLTCPIKQLFLVKSPVDAEGRFNLKAQN
jgi:hypothetical protein